LPKFTRRRFVIIAGVIAAILVIAGISLFWSQFFLNEYDEKQLKLIPSENAQSIISGQNITISIEVYNSGSTSIFNASNLWPIIDGGKHRLTVSPCSSDYPYGLAIISGYVNNSSIASSIPLNIWEPGIYMCPVVLVSGYEILGFSDQGYMLTAGNSPTPITLSSTVSFSGYWVASNPINNSNPLNNSYNFIYFPVGQYTVFIADEWGETALLHFTVT
jgi:hypothetical protein